MSEAIELLKKWRERIAIRHSYVNWTEMPFDLTHTCFGCSGCGAIIRKGLCERCHKVYEEAVADLEHDNKCPDDLYCPCCRKSLLDCGITGNNCTSCGARLTLRLSALIHGRMDVAGTDRTWSNESRIQATPEPDAVVSCLPKFTGIDPVTGDRFKNGIMVEFGSEGGRDSR